MTSECPRLGNDTRPAPFLNTVLTNPRRPNVRTPSASEPTDVKQTAPSLGGVQWQKCSAPRCLPQSLTQKRHNNIFHLSSPAGVHAVRKLLTGSVSKVALGTGGLSEGDLVSEQATHSALHTGVSAQHTNHSLFPSRCCEALQAANRKRQLPEALRGHSRQLLQGSEKKEQI